jgi:hypothetical protein
MTICLFPWLSVHFKDKGYRLFVSELAGCDPFLAGLMFLAGPQGQRGPPRSAVEFSWAVCVLAPTVSLDGAEGAALLPAVLRADRAANGSGQFLS